MIPWWFIYNPHIGSKSQSGKLRTRDVFGITFVAVLALFIIFAIYYVVFNGRS